MSVWGNTLTTTERMLCDQIRSYVGSPAYKALISSSSTLLTASVTEREFYLALCYFPRKFTAIYEELLTQFSAAYVRSEQLLRGRHLSQGECLRDPISVGTFVNLTLPRVQRALGSQIRGVLVAVLSSLSVYRPYYQRALQLHSQSLISVVKPLPVVDTASSVDTSLVKPLPIVNTASSVDTSVVNPLSVVDTASSVDTSVVNPLSVVDTSVVKPSQWNHQPRIHPSHYRKR